MVRQQVTRATKKGGEKGKTVVVGTSLNQGTKVQVRDKTCKTVAEKRRISHSKRRGDDNAVTERAEKRKKFQPPNDYPASLLKQWGERNMPSTYLHVLPGELRNVIYRYVGRRSQRLNLTAREEPALLKAIPDLGPELRSIIFAENKLEVDVYSSFKLYSSKIACLARIAVRGGKYGAGRLAIEEDNWIRQADPRAVRIRNIGLHVLEMGGYPICTIFLNVKTQQGGNVVSITVKNISSMDVKRRLDPYITAARNAAKDFAAGKGFIGYSLEQLDKLAACFECAEEV